MALRLGTPEGGPGSPHAPADPPTGGGPGNAGGLVALLVAVTGFSWGFVIVKALPLAPAALAFWRLLLAAGVLSVVALVLRVPWPRHPGAVVAAGIAFGAHQLLYIGATKATSIAIVTLLGALQPLLVSLVSRRVVGERVPRALRLCALLAVAGVAVVVQANLGDDSRSLTGDLLACANVVAFTAYFLFAKRAREQGARTLTLTAASFVAALLVATPAMLVEQWVGTPAEGGFLPSAAVFAGVAFLALVPGSGHLLVNWAHPRVSAALASLVLASIPLLSSVWAHFVFGEPYGVRHVVGMLLVMAAIEGGRRAERRRPEPVPTV